MHYDIVHATSIRQDQPTHEPGYSFMKYIFYALLLSSTLPLFGQAPKTEPLTTNDIASILGISATRYMLTFNSDTDLVLETEYSSSLNITKLGRGKSISVVIFEEGKGSERSLGIITYAPIGVLTSYLPAPWPVAAQTFQRTTFADDIFSVVGSDKNDFSSFKYRVRILPASKVERGN